MRLVPTSITVAPGLDHLGGHQRGEPTAATRMSARRRPRPRSRVREWHMVTVAFAFEQQRASGRPTRIERPTMTASAPSTSARAAQQLHHALRRARHQARAALASRPALGGEAVDVLRRVDRGDHLVLVDLLGQRQLDEDPVDLVVGVQLGDQREQLVLRRLGVELVVDRAHPDLLGGAGACCDVDLRGRVVADQHGREPGRAAVRSAANALTARPRRGPRRPPPCRRSPARTTSARLLQRRVVRHQLALGALGREADDDHRPRARPR